MSYKIVELHRDKGYTFLIGTKERTSRNRERIERALAGVWGELFPQTPDSDSLVPPYGFELVPDSVEIDGLPTLPGFERGKTYLVFVLAKSETAVSEEEENETARGILRAIGSSLGDSSVRPKVGVMMLYKCSVSIMENDAVRPWLAWETPEEFVRGNFRAVRNPRTNNWEYQDPPPRKFWE